MIHVLLIHQAQLIRSLIASALEDDPAIRVTGQAASLSEAWEIAGNQSLDAILISSGFQEKELIAFLEQVNECDDGINVIIAGINLSRENVIKFVEAGTTAYLKKGSAIADMIEALHLADQDMAKMPPGVTAALIDRLAAYAHDFSEVQLDLNDRSQLTERELQVLELLGQEKSNREIAQELVIELGTVKNHVHSILSKLNVRTRADAADYLVLLRK